MLYVFIIIFLIVIVLSIFKKSIEPLDGDELTATTLTETSTGEGIYNDISYNYDIIAQSFSASDVNNPYTSYDESNLKYDSTLKNLNVEYHKSADEIIKESSLPFGTIVVQNASGQLVYLRDPQIIGTPIYYDSLNIRYNPQSYVPNYEDAMYLRDQYKYQEPPIVEQPPADNFCKTAATRGSKYNQETLCQSVPSNKCHMYDCCVNLGGAKCVAGNQYGPLLNSNYGDIFVRNRDYYYYQGLCYGNCKGSLPPISAWIPKN